MGLNLRTLSITYEICWERLLFIKVFPYNTTLIPLMRFLPSCHLPKSKQKGNFSSNWLLNLTSLCLGLRPAALLLFHLLVSVTSLSPLYFAFLFSLSSPEFVPFFCSLSLGHWGQHNCIFVHKILHFKHNTVVTKRLFVGLSSVSDSSPLFWKLCLSCSFPCFLPLCRSVSHFEPRRLPDRYSPLSFHSCSNAAHCAWWRHSLNHAVSQLHTHR